MSEKFPYDELTQDLFRIIKKHNGQLPQHGLVKIVLKESRAWRENEKGHDRRGSGNAIGRRLRRMYNHGLINESTDREYWVKPSWVRRETAGSQANPPPEGK